MVGLCSWKTEQEVKSVTENFWPLVLIKIPMSLLNEVKTMLILVKGSLITKCVNIKVEQGCSKQNYMRSASISITSELC